MPLLDLPPELLLQIAPHLESVRDIYHLALVNHSFNQIFESEIQKRDTLDQYGAELLRYAAMDDRESILKMISLGADINFRPPDYLRDLKTVLHSAIETNNVELVKFLLENGAQPNFVLHSQRYDFCSLQMAIVRTKCDEELPIMNLLLDYGADPNMYSVHQCTPLMEAVRIDYLPKMELLLARGADVNQKGWRGLTPIHFTIQKGTRHAAFFIEKGSEVNCVNEDGISPLMSAMDRSAARGTAEALLNAGANVHFTNHKGRNAWLEAARFGVPRNAELLLAHGADLHYIGPIGRNALYDSLCRGYHKHIPMLNFLLGRGLEVDSRDANQQTPLLFFVSHKDDALYLKYDCPVIQFLLDQGASITAKDIEGATVLHHAAKSKSTDVFKWLSDRMVDVNECDLNGETPIFWALKNFLTIRVLDTIKALLKLGADDRHVNAHGQTVLCMAAHIWCPQSTSLFLERGADINHKDNEGMTPLHWCAANESIPADKRSLGVLEILITHGADVNARTHAGATPLGMIRKKHTTRHIRKMLIDAGAVEDSG